MNKKYANLVKSSIKKLKNVLKNLNVKKMKDMLILLINVLKKDML